MVGPASPRPSVIVAASPQESCARVLLFRGANKDVRNYNSQTAFQVQDVKGWPKGLLACPADFELGFFFRGQEGSARSKDCHQRWNYGWASVVLRI